MTNKKNLNSEEQKSLNLFKSNFLEYSKKTTAHDSSNEEICNQSYLIEDFVQKKLHENKRDTFVSHIADCDSCREVVSVLISTKALELLENYDTSVSQSYVLQGNTSQNLWVQAKDGLLELKQNIKLSIQNGFQNIESKLIMSDNLVFRGEEKLAFAKPQYIEITLPNNNGEIKLSYIQTAKTSGKIKIDIESLKDSNSFIDILDANEILLKSFEGKKVVEIDVSKEASIVQINMKYKLKLDLL